MASTSNNLSLNDLVSQNSCEALLECLLSKKWAKKEINEALLTAAKVGSSACFQSLLDAGANVSHKDVTDRNSLHYVLRYGKGNLDIVKSALSGKVKKSPQAVSKTFLNVKDKKGAYPIYYAAERGYIDCIKELISAGAAVDLPNVYDRDTGLMVACSKGHANIVKVLIEAGSDVNKKNFFQQTPLLFAAQKGNTECTKLLIEAGADVNEYDYSGHSPLTKACENGNVDTVKLLLDQGANLQQTDGSGRSPLFLATAAQRGPVVQYLIEKGAYVNQTNSIGLSPFVMAVKRDDLALVKLLVDHDCNVYQKYMEHGTAIHMCCISNSFECLRFLLESKFGSGFCLNECDEKGKLPLTLACERLCSENVLTLLKHGADPNQRDLHGRTPLVCAIRGCRVYPWNGLNVIKGILRFGCDANLNGKFDLCVITNNVEEAYSDEDLQSPFEVATRLGNVGTVKMLWTAGSSRGATATWCESNLRWYSALECDVIISESAKNSIISYFEEISGQPRTLAECCRITIRRTLGTSLPEKIDHLGLPDAIKEYLNLPELDDIDNKYSNNEEDSDEDCDEEILTDSDFTDSSVSGTEVEMSDTDGDSD